MEHTHTRALLALKWPIHGLCACLLYLQLQAALTPDKRLENEAEQLRLIHLLLTLEGKSTQTADSPRSSSSQGGSRRSSLAAGKTALKSASQKGSLQGSTSSTAAVQLPASLGSSVAPPPAACASSPGPTGTRRLPVAPKLPELVSGHYLLDFGCVTKGVNKSRKVKMTNMSTQQVKHYGLKFC